MLLKTITEFFVRIFGMEEVFFLQESSFSKKNKTQVSPGITPNQSALCIRSVACHALKLTVQNAELSLVAQTVMDCDTFMLKA